MSLKFADIYRQKGYLSQFCENIFKENNFREEPAFKDMPERMAYETEIWMVGEQLRQEISKLKQKEIAAFPLEEIINVIDAVRYGKGRESFVMTLHYFKNNHGLETYLGNLLCDNDLYGFAVKELNKLKLYHCTDKVRDILKNEKINWIRKEAERYIQNSLVK
ncbi:MAG: hypothetical protein LBK94_08315 [Prevotellaceae bacterium]|jgi:hypothetical protein|nr:hypothetical protein [Prevotellaceae bacterium]